MRRWLTTGLTLAALTACHAGDGAAVRSPLALRATVAFQPGWRVLATSGDIDHLTFRLVSASDGATVAGTVEARPPFVSPLTLQLPPPANGSYRMTVEAFGAAGNTASLSLGDPLLSTNTVAINDRVVTYSTGTALTFPSALHLKTGGTVQATVTGSGGNRVDVAVMQGATTLAQLPYASAAFPVRHLPPGTYVLRGTLYTPGGVVDRSVDSAPVTVAGPETGYAADGPFTLAF